MTRERPPLNRLEVLRALRISNWEAVYATVHGTLTGGAFQTGFALWLGASNLWMGIASSIPTIAALAQLVSAYFVERAGERRKVTAWFSVLSRLLWIPILLVPVCLPPAARLPAFIALLLVSSLMLHWPIPAFTSWMSDLVPPDHRGRYFGRRNMLAGITAMVVSLPAAWFLDQATKAHRFPEWIGFGVLFGIGALFGFFSFLCLLRQPEPPMAHAAPESGLGIAGVLAFYRTPFADRTFRAFMIFSALFALGQFLAAPFYTVYAIQQLKLDYMWLQILGALASFTAMLAMPLWGYLGDKFGNKPVMVLAVAGVATQPLPWLFCSPAQPTLSIVLLSLNSLVGGVVWSGVGLLQFNMLIDCSPSERRSVYVGALSATTGLLGGLAPVLGGILMNAMEGVRLVVLGHTFVNFHLLFTLNAALRAITLLPLRSVRTSATTAPREVLSQLGGGGVGAFVQLRRLQHGQTEGERLRAAQALSSARTALAVDELIAAMEDPSLNVRVEAAAALGEIGDRRAVEPLCAKLRDPAAGIAIEAVNALGKIGDPSATPDLVTVFRRGEPAERIAAARALGAVASPEALEALRSAVADPASPDEVVAASIAALSSAQDTAAAPVIATRLDRSKRTVHIEAIRALGHLGDPGTAEPLLRQLEAEQDPGVVAHLAVALALLGAREAVGPLLDRIQATDNPIALKQLVHAVGTLLGFGDALYPLLSVDSLACTEAVSRLFREISNAEGKDRDRPFGARRRARLIDIALERYLAGDLSAAVLTLGRALGPRLLRADTPLAQTLRWAETRARAGRIRTEEMLLALFAARQATSAG